MSWIRDLPIKKRLSAVVLLTCTLVLLLAAAGLAAYELYDFRRALARDTTVLADILGTNARGALAFQDDATAREMLSSLQSEPGVVAACIYARDGSRFAEYTRRGAAHVFPPGPEADGARFENGHLSVFRPLVLNARTIGTLHLRVDLQRIHERLRLFGLVAALILAGSLGVALVLSARLQRPVLEPILALAETAENIARRKDYTARAPRLPGHNEVGLLTDAFNQMLAGIQEREGALHTANAALRAEIGERELAEHKVRAQLSRLAQLHQITRAIGDRQDTESIFQAVAGSLENDMPVDFSCVCLLDRASGALVVSSVGARSDLLAKQIALSKKTTIPVDQNGLARCVRGQLIYEPDIALTAQPFTQQLAAAGLRSLVLAPLAMESSVFGVLINARFKADGFSSGECEFLRQLSELVALAAHQAQLHGALQQAYDDLRQSQQTALQQERLRALGQMASGIAHDINNALSPVALYTESLLENEPALSERARNYLGTIQHAVEDVAETVSRMREFYRQREPQLTLAPVQLNHVVAQVADLTRARWYDMPQLRGVVIELHRDLAPDLPAVAGVESEIREALTNLIFNAVDAMPEGGHLTLRTRKIETRTPSGRELKTSVHLEVVDTGAGMDEETRRRCLEPFFTTKGERGTGLGLAMVYGAVQRHGAEIEIESAVGRGTTLRIVFDAPAAMSSPAPRKYAGGEKPPRTHILVVDDDPLLIKSLRDTLETDGHIVVAANGGLAGIDAFRAAQDKGKPFAVVITDLGMPHVDGRKVAAAVKAASPATPVILLTGWGQRMLAEGDIPPHVDRVLSKPPKLRELREALISVLSSTPPTA